MDDYLELNRQHLETLDMTPPEARPRPERFKPKIAKIFENISLTHANKTAVVLAGLAVWVLIVFSAR